MAQRPKLGLALGSGAARGWAHAGIMRALDEIGVEVDIYAGCSAGALVSAARLLGIWDRFTEWAKSLDPLTAAGTFGFGLARGGFINPDKAYKTFMDADREIGTLEKKWGAVATDLATGREVWLSRGSVLEACRASAAVPIIMQSARFEFHGREHWFIDGAASNPVPVSLARALGADRVIAVDLNAVTLALTRFNRPETRAVVAVESETYNSEGFLAPVEGFFRAQSQDLARRLALAKAKARAEPQFLETVFATIDIVQAQLAEARAKVDIADLRLTPDLSIASAAAFDEWEAFEEIGYASAMARADEIRLLAQADDIEESALNTV